MCSRCVEDRSCRCVCAVHSKGRTPSHCPACSHTEESPKTGGRTA